jgi:hypothetical protein
MHQQRRGIEVSASGVDPMAVKLQIVACVALDIVFQTQQASVYSEDLPDVGVEPLH